MIIFNCVNSKKDFTAPSELKLKSVESEKVYIPGSCYRNKKYTPYRLKTVEHKSYQYDRSS